MTAPVPTESTVHQGSIRHDRALSQNDAWERLEAALTDIEQRYRCVITVHDAVGRTHDAGGLPRLKPGRYRHRHPHCRAGRSLETPWDRCFEHCWQFVHGKALVHRQPFVHGCYRSALEVVVPLFQNGQHIVNLFGGPFQSQQANPRSSLTTPAPAHLPILVESDAESLSRALEALGSWILRLCEEPDPHAQSTERDSAIRRFLRNSAAQPLRIRDLAEHLSVSPSRAGHIVKELFGKPFSQLLMEERLRAAKVLLLTTNLSTRTIAERAGFNSESYFFRSFQKHIGCSPTTFREREQRRDTHSA